jgi:hypothetical protein
MKKLYVVDLTKEEKAELLELVRKGEARVRKMNRAHILLLADEGRTDKDIAQALHTRAPPQSSGRAGALWKAGFGARPQRVAASWGQAQARWASGSVPDGLGLLRSSRGQKTLEEYADARR